MRKKYNILCIALSVCMLLSTAPATLAVAEEIEPAAYSDCAAALLVEMNSQQPILVYEADTIRPIAGLCKLPAMLVVCEAIDQGLIKLDTEVQVSGNAASVSGPTAFIEAGEMIAAKYLLKAAVMISAGDAMMALGEALYGTETAFMDQIATRLNALGIPATMQNAVGNGLELSPSMLAKIGAALMQSPSFCAHSKLTLETFTHADGRVTELVSANRLLREFAGCTGIATGSMGAENYCGVFAVTRGDTSFICVVLGAKKSGARFSIAQAMLSQAYATIRTQVLARAGDVLVEGVRVKGGRMRSVNLVAKNTVVLLLDKAEPSLQTVKSIPETLSAPLTQDDVVGSITYQTADGVAKGSVELVVQEPLGELQYRDCISEILLAYLRM